MSDYVPNDFLKETVSSKDEYDVRGALVGIILSDSSFSRGDIHHAIRYAEANGINVFEPHDPSMEITEDPSQWNGLYFARVANQLRRNFSRERITHLQSVGRKVYGQPAKPAVNMQPQNSSVQTKVNNNRAHRNDIPDINNENRTPNFDKGRQAIIWTLAGAAVLAAVIIVIIMNL